MSAWGQSHFRPAAGCFRSSPAGGHSRGSPKALSTSNASSFERHRLAMLFTPLPPRALARGGEGRGGGGVAATPHAPVPPDSPPPPDPKSELRSSRPRRFAGGGEKKSVLAHV